MSETLKKINYLTEEQYKSAKENGEINENEIYLTPDCETLEYSRILWVNPAPNATQFSPQEITFSSDDYDFFDILYYCYYDVHVVECARVYKEHTPANLATTFKYNNRLYGGHRTITKVNDKKYSISSVSCNPFGGTGADTTNDWIIPIIVYAGKVQRKNNENIVANPDIYSINETVIGEYLNKPLYRKIIQFTSFSNIPKIGANFDVIINARMMVQADASQDNTWRPFPWLFTQNNGYGSASWAGGYYISTSGEVKVQAGSSISSISRGILIIEYTKTTD